MLAALRLAFNPKLALSFIKMSRFYSNSRQNIVKMQQLKLAKIVSYASKYVPYYIEVCQNINMDSECISIQDLPVLSKKDYSKNLSIFISEKCKNRRLVSTSGTTGAKFHFYKDSESTRKATLAEHIGYNMLGYSMLAKKLSIWGARQDIINPNRAAIGLLKDYLRSHKVLDGYKVSQKAVECYYETIQKWKPSLLIGYPSTLCDVFSKLPADMKKLPHPKAILCSGEMLADIARTKLEKLSGKPVFNRYGSREFGVIAHDCIYGKMHLMSERVYVEVLRDDLLTQCEPGEEGEIVVTDLDRKAMPLIRYRIGDRGVIGTELCSCGRETLILERVTGRSLDSVKCRNGESISPYYWTHSARSIPGIERFRIMQDCYDYVVVLAKIEEGGGKDSLRRLQDKFNEELAGKIKVIVKECDEFPVSESGKYKFIESKL